MSSLILTLSSKNRKIENKNKKKIKMKDKNEKNLSPPFVNLTVG